MMLGHTVWVERDQSSKAFALTLARQWQNLIDEGVVVEATG
jgi:hypothetical protein